MNSNTNKLKEQIIKLGINNVNCKETGSVFFFHKVPVPEILSNTTKRLHKKPMHKIKTIKLMLANEILCQSEAFAAVYTVNLSICLRQTLRLTV